jgi:hypothetical protein
MKHVFLGRPFFLLGFGNHIRICRNVMSFRIEGMHFSIACNYFSVEEKALAVTDSFPVARKVMGNFVYHFNGAIVDKSKKICRFVCSQQQRMINFPAWDWFLSIKLFERALL